MHQLESFNNRPTPLPRCLPHNFVSSFYKGNTESETNRSSIVIDMCPHDLGNVTSCFNAKDIRDYIFVSAVSDGRVYRNRKCADCNGEGNVVEWSVLLHGCPEVTLISKVTEIPDAVLQSCRILNVPPLELQSKIGNFECLNTKMISECNSRVNVSKEIKDQCENPPHRMRHDFFLHGRQVYRNYFCFLCSLHDAVPFTTCPGFDLVSKIPEKGESFYALLDFRRVFSEQKNLEVCHTQEFLDPFTVSYTN